MSLLSLSGVEALAPAQQPCSPWTFRAREVVVGAHPYEIETDYGLFAAAAIRRVAAPMPVAHGIMSPGPDYLGEQQIVIPVAITGPTSDDALAAMATLSADWVPAAEPIEATVGTPLGTFLITGKPDPLDVPNLADLRDANLIRGTLRWYVTDPTFRTVGSSQIDLVLGGVVQPSGYGFSHGFSYGFSPGAGASHTAWAYNSGNFQASWVAVISGPVPIVNPALVLLSTGDTIRCLTTVPVGFFLIIDQAARTVWLSADPDDISGAADRSNTVDYPDSADWWSLPPGSAQVRFQATSGDGGHARLTWHSTFLL